MIEKLVQAWDFNSLIRNTLVGIILGVVLMGGYFILKNKYKVDLMEAFRKKPAPQSLEIKAPAVPHSVNDHHIDPRVPIHILQSSDTKVALVINGVRITLESDWDE